jgi:O-succinylhomoserine sulfhydrylase
MRNKNKFETDAIRTQLERSQFQEHSNPLFLTSSFVFEDAEEMRAAFAEEKGTQCVQSFYQSPTLLNLFKKCVL